ncbi:MAG: hypothetical protein H6718_19195 [Polyangiaceae bacterium]|nr:hypothetical protein [Myxococcales bacterium]MCB9587536.1 hypothetical protein [Polyangiaceae bacterium]MCB9605667.1 hypothetical protein [Polyangiaceae bacterium]
MTANRKLRRAQQARKQRAPVQAPTGVRAPVHLDKAKLRRQSSAERFAREGSELLWVRLLAWEGQRLSRARLLDAVHDAALWKQAAAESDQVPPYQASGALAPLAAREKELAGKLSAEKLDAAVEVWRRSGDDYHPKQPAPKWQFLAELSMELELGEVTALELQEDWELWISLAFASEPRVVAMEALRTAENHLASLGEITHGEHLKAAANAVRAIWSGLAYGDETTFKRVRSWSDDWLASLAERSGSSGSGSEGGDQ